MPRRPNIVRPTDLEIQVPEPLRAKLDLHLWSAVEGRVPHGAYTRFLNQLLNDFFDRLASAKEPS